MPQVHPCKHDFEKEGPASNFLKSTCLFRKRGGLKIVLKYPEKR